MRPFLNYDGHNVDLDDVTLYEHLPNTHEELRKLMFSEIGYYYCYVKFWHRDTSFCAQKKRVKKLIKNFTENEVANYDNLLWYKEQIFIFQDEIENMC